jgi:hypothetical protein
MKALVQARGNWARFWMGERAPEGAPATRKQE